MELKPPKTFDEQVALLKEKHVTIDDDDACHSFLQHVNYYRLSAYFLPFRGPDGKCFKNIPFNRIQKIYEFDQLLRALVMNAIEDIEIHIRTQLAYYHAHAYGPSGYMSPKNYNNRHDHNAFLDHVKICIRENRNTLVVKHHLKNYEGNFPLWVIIEFFPIGMLSHFYRSFKTHDKKKVAKALYNTNYNNLESWMRCITDLRNKCAHYSRIYYWLFPAIPKIPAGVKYIPTRRIFAQLYMLKMMYPDPKKWEKQFMKPLRILMEQFMPFISLKHLDFPDQWDNMLSVVLKG